MQVSALAHNTGPANWLRSVGFRFDPFQHLEASEDPFLGDYLVGHASFAAAWDSAPALIFAQAGGGKTSMRIYAARTCWIGSGDPHPFPIVHQPYTGAAPLFPTDLDYHLTAIVRAGAVALLLDLAHRPDRLLALAPRQQQEVARFLDAALPGPLARYLAVAGAAGTPHVLIPLLDRTFPTLDSPTVTALGEFCACLSAARPAVAATALSPRDAFAQMCEVLLSTLAYRSIFVLVDGVDSQPETATSDGVAVAWLAPLLAQGSVWAWDRIYLKGFLPAELQPALRAALPIVSAEAHASVQLQTATIVWTPPVLAEVIRRRVYVASGGSFGSLDAISSPALRDLETVLARMTPPRPRELIWLARQLLTTSVRRSGGNEVRIEWEDVERVEQLYVDRLTIQHEMLRCAVFV